MIRLSPVSQRRVLQSYHKDHVCSFSAEIFDEVMAAFVSESRVAISGRETLKNGNIDVSIFNEVSDDSA